MYIYKAAVVGAGTMGGEIAQVISFSGLPVVMKDVDQKMLDTGMRRVKAIYKKRVSKGKMSDSDMMSKVSLVTPTLTYDGFDDADLVIEAVPEDIAIKKKVFAELDEKLPQSAIIASNTSALSISEMARATRRPEKVVGMHFFNPAHVMKLVEVIPGVLTSDETVDDTVTFTESLRKLAVRVEECPGFLVNRLLSPYLNEAVMALQEGAATAQQIDDAMREFGWPMGPFTLMDMLGLDICVKVGLYLERCFGLRMKGASLMEKLYKAGRYGTRSGAGFYNYKDESDRTVEDLIAETQKETGVKGTSFTPERLNLLLANEAIYCLQERISVATDIDVATMAGIGFPMPTEGVLHYADSMGLDVVLEKLEGFASELGPRFTPHWRLRKMVAGGLLGKKSGKGFFDYVG